MAGLEQVGMGVGEDLPGCQPSSLLWLTLGLWAGHSPLCASVSSPVK